ncbi:MAG TPA: class I SAM-dependent methyltransferase [Bacillota bacterium]|nr:class I SAM-dependent methyltransferase [Bacillota bacterium]
MSSNSSSYHALAAVYDQLMGDAPYDQWIEFAQKQWAHLGLKPRTVIDLACGTGTITSLLVEYGYQLIGVDLSEDMLAVTYDKLKEKGRSIQLYQQDMRELKVPSSVDAIVCFCDSISYLTEDLDVQKTFHRVYEALNPGGVFLFDIHSPYKVNEVFGNETYTLSEEDIAYIWQCYSLGNDTVQHELDIFVKEDEFYQRYEEIHQQRGYSTTSIQQWLMEAGFVEIESTADFLEQQPAENSERLFFRAIRR